MGGDHTLDGEPKITLPYEYLYIHMYIYKTISNRNYVNQHLLSDVGFMHNFCPCLSWVTYPANANFVAFLPDLDIPYFFTSSTIYETSLFLQFLCSLLAMNKGFLHVHSLVILDYFNLDLVASLIWSFIWSHFIILWAFWPLFFSDIWIHILQLKL